MMELLQVMINAVKGVETKEFSKEQTSDAIRNALIEVNGGSTKIDIKTCYRGSKIFSLIQELIPVIIDEGFKDEDAIFKFVEYKNIAEGDVNEFDIEGNSLFIVADAAAGVKGIRRQRIDDGQTVTVKTSLKLVRIYEELNRLMSGRVNFDTFVANVAKAFKQQALGDVYAAINAISSSTTGLNSTYVVAGTAQTNESALLTLIGKKATILGTKAALRKLSTAVTSDSAKEDLYALGYYGKFNGTECFALRQSHKVGTTTFNITNDKVFVVAGDDRFIKVVNEGNGILIEKNPAENQDLTQEYIYGQTMGVAVICSQAIGVFSIA